MNETQQIFIVFFAIFWGTVANAQPRWKAFQFPLFLVFGPATLRLILSIIILNILPIAFFCWTIWMLSGSNPNLSFGGRDWTVCSVIQLIIHGVIPAFATFGFYRLWLGIIETKPTLFYGQEPSNVPEEYRGTECNIGSEPTVSELKLNSASSFRNIFFGIIYIIVAFCASQVWR